MPQVRGHVTDTPENPAGRIQGTRRMLTTAALIMSAFLIASSFITVILIPGPEFEPGGQANGRALAFLAHEYLGSGFGTVYDVSTIPSSGSPGRRLWQVCSTSFRSTSPATGWRPNGPRPSGPWCSCSR
jgi:hypothetical protein